MYKEVESNNPKKKATNTVKWTTEDLWEADPKCRHKVVSAGGGGVRCIKCGGWHCY